jgi:hypothetical protein
MTGGDRLAREMSGSSKVLSLSAEVKPDEIAVGDEDEEEEEDAEEADDSMVRLGSLLSVSSVVAAEVMIGGSVPAADRAPALLSLDGPLGAGREMSELP